MKKDLYDLLWTLDAKYGLGLGMAPCLHPPIVFIDYPFKQALVKKLKVGKFMSRLKRN